MRRTQVAILFKGNPSPLGMIVDTETADGWIAGQEIPNVIKSYVTPDDATPNATFMVASSEIAAIQFVNLESCR